MEKGDELMNYPRLLFVGFHVNGAGPLSWVVETCGEQPHNPTDVTYRSPVEFKELEVELRSRIKEQAETIERLGTLVRASNGRAEKYKKMLDGDELKEMY